MSKFQRIEPLSVREVGLIPLVGLTIFGLSFLANKTTLSTGEMAVWPADALSLAFMLGPMRKRPILALIIGRIAAEAFSAFIKFPLLTGFLVDSESMLGIGIIYFCLKRTDYSRIYYSINLLILFMVSCLGCAVTAVMQSLTISALMHLDAIKIMRSCFAANFVGYVALTPLTLIMFDRLSEKIHLNTDLLRNTGLLMAFSVYAWFASASSLPLLFLIPIGLMALAYLTNLGVVACGVLVSGLCLLIATCFGYGTISTAGSSASAHLLILQFFLAVITTSILPMAARMAEHKRLHKELVDARLEAETANGAKSQFLATISHEIRTPLNGVLGMAQIMALGALEPEQKDRLKIIRKSGEMLLSILNDVLDLSKIEAGKLAIEAIEFDLSEVLHATIHAYRSLAEDKGLRFSQHYDGVEGVFTGDPTRVRQILTNLISNALKFTETGEIGVSMRFGADTLHLSVSDTGIGMSPDQVGKLFNQFTQADATTTRRFGGTGLGLSICRQLANLMGGRIEVESEEGRGSTFTASIPMIRIGDAEPAEACDSAKAEAFGAGVKVLAAEDNQTNQLVMRTLLEMVGYEVLVVADGAEAVSRWEQEDWDVILMDVQMPVMDGPTATRAIRIREAATGRRRTPIIALTANTMSHQVDSYRADGMDGHVAKPIDAEALFEAIVEATHLTNEGLAVGRQARETKAA